MSREKKGCRKKKGHGGSTPTAESERKGNAGSVTKKKKERRLRGKKIIMPLMALQKA